MSIILRAQYDELQTQFNKLSAEYDSSTHYYIFENLRLKADNKALESKVNELTSEKYQQLSEYKKTIAAAYVLKQLRKENYKLNNLNF